jgi:hypothetical protein
VPLTRICEWLPEIAYLNISVHAHKNAYEPATSLELWQNSGSGLLLDVRQLLSDFRASCKLLVASVMAVEIPLLSKMVLQDGELMTPQDRIIQLLQLPEQFSDGIISPIIAH